MMPPQHATSRLPSVAVAVTVRDLDAAAVTWVWRLIAAGVDRLYLYLDDPSEPTRDLVAGLPGVVLVDSGPSERKAYGSLVLSSRLLPHVATEVMARQCLNAELALARAQSDGVDWLLHLDADELIEDSDVPLKVALGELPKEVDVVSLWNDEAVPDGEQVDDPFAEVTLFRRNPRHLSCSLLSELKARFGVHAEFLGYVNGKGAARTDRNVLPTGVHGFRRLDGSERAVTLDTGPSLIHFVDCGLDRYVKKYVRLGAFSDHWFGRWAVGPEFHVASRNAFSAAGEAGLARLYRERRLLGPAVRNGLLQAGALVVRHTESPPVQSTAPSAASTSTLESPASSSAR